MNVSSLCAGLRACRTRAMRFILAFLACLLLLLLVLLSPEHLHSALAQVPIGPGRKFYCEYCREFTIPWTVGTPLPTICPQCKRPTKWAGSQRAPRASSSGKTGATTTPLEQALARISVLNREIDALYKLRGRQDAELEPILREIATLKRDYARLKGEMEQRRRTAIILENARLELMRMQKSYADRESDSRRSFEAILRLRSGVPAHLLSLPPSQVAINLSALSSPRAEVRLSEAELAVKINPHTHITRHAYEAARRDRVQLELAQRVLGERLAALDATNRDLAAKTATIESIRADASFGMFSASLGVLTASPETLQFLPNRDRALQVRLMRQWSIAVQAASLATATYESSLATSHQEAYSRLANAGVELLKLKTALRMAGLTPKAAKRLELTTNTVDALVKIARFQLDPSVKNRLAYFKAGAEVLAAFSLKGGGMLAGLKLAAYAGQYQATDLLAIEWQKLQAPPWDARAHLHERIQRNEAALKEVKRLISGFESLQRNKEAKP